MLPKKDFVFLDNALKSESGFGFGKHQLLFTNPHKQLVLKSFKQVNSFFDDIERLSKNFWLAGYFTYELGHYFNTGIAKAINTPLAWLGVFDEPKEPNQNFLSMTQSFDMSQGALSQTKQEYFKAIDLIKLAIESGVTYQVNYCLAYLFKLCGDPWGLYKFMRSQQPVSHGAVLQCANMWAISASPELFFNCKSNKLRSKPMKGTACRGRNNYEDNQQSKWLQNDIKSRAENAMIVDLLRNDIGALSELGSVKVKNLFDIEKYPSLLQMVSSVEGKLKNNTSWQTMFTKLFPCGSITGAPKISTMHLIDQLETRPRGVYTGAIGYIHKNLAEFSVPIRTVQLQENPLGDFNASLGLGSGIIMDSDAQSEFDECLLKAKFLQYRYPDFQLLETMLCKNGTIELLDYHLNRVRESAIYFGWDLNHQLIKQQILSLIVSLKGYYRIRMLIFKDGRCKIEKFSFKTDKSNQLLNVTISNQRIDLKDCFHLHKTTNRSFYDKQFSMAQKRGFADIVFCNKDGLLTQGAISNIWIKRKGVLLTPPVYVGALPGVYRQYLLDRGAKESKLYLDDLKNADEIYLSNALRGLRRVTLNIN